MNLLKDSIRLTRINDRMTLKLKAMASQNSSLKVELDDMQDKVGQMENQQSILSDQLLDAGVNSDLLRKQVEKTLKELEVKRQELETCNGEKVDLNVKLRRVHTELATAPAFDKSHEQRVKKNWMKSCASKSWTPNMVLAMYMELQHPTLQVNLYLSRDPHSSPVHPLCHILPPWILVQVHKKRMCPAQSLSWFVIPVG